MIVCLTQSRSDAVSAFDGDSHDGVEPKRVLNGCDPNERTVVGRHTEDVIRS